MIMTWKYRLLPSKRQHVVLREILHSQRELYNAALQERIDCYHKTGKGRSFIDQCKALTECRRDIPEMAALSANLQRWTLKRLDDAYAAFFRRLKTKKDKAGFPRFRGSGWWSSFGFNEFSGITFDGKRLRFKGMSSGIRVHLHRPLPKDAAIKSCVFKKDVKGWSICFQIETGVAKAQAISSPIGIDMGLKSLAVCSDGLIIPNARFSRRAEREFRVRQCALARCKRRSKRRKKVRDSLARAHAKIANARRTYLHQSSSLLTKRYDLIAVEALNIKGLASGMLAKSVHDAGWGTFVNMLRYKAERAGGVVIEVDPKLTTQACSRCGVIVRKGLADRVHSCPECGLVLDRDHNAALNILHRGVVAARHHNVVQWDERAAGKLTLVSE